GGEVFGAPGAVRANFYGFEMARLAIMPHFDSVEIEHDRAPRGSRSALPCVPSQAIAELVIGCGARDKTCPFRAPTFPRLCCSRVPAAARIEYLSRQSAWMLIEHVIRTDRLLEGAQTM